METKVVHTHEHKGEYSQSLEVIKRGNGTSYVSFDRTPNNPVMGHDAGSITVVDIYGTNVHSRVYNVDLIRPLLAEYDAWIARLDKPVIE